MKKPYLMATLLLLSPYLFGQEAPMESMPLNDLSGFQSQAGNWMIVGEVTIDPTTDIHHQEAPPEESSRKKRKKKQSSEASSAASQSPVTYEAGTGILLNMNDETTKDNLLSSWEHGDILLELEVMMPKGSNSGIYLQGRYEIQLLDSWGVKHPKYGDIGGIYRNWETQKEKIYLGKAPLTNAAKAPGLWQTMKIAFRAPRFDASGNKIENARFVYVDLNGERIHENVEVPLPTGGPVENNEVPRGPLMIQGDHGPVAFRNIRYHQMEETSVSLTDLQYKVFDNASGKLDSLMNASPASEGSLDQLTAALPGVLDNFTILYQGALEAPEAGDYQFRLNYMGRILLQVDGEEALAVNNYDNYRGESEVTLSLPAGKTPFTLVYYKETPPWPVRLGIFSTDSYPRALHQISSFPPESPETGPIYVNVQDEPRLLRAFLDYEGQRDQRLTHTIGVGGPSGVHYVYNLITGSPVCVWRGEFLNATPMWHQRGDGSFRPRGAVQHLFAGPSLAQLSSSNAAFPATLNEPGAWKGQGYRIDEATGEPVFIYQMDGQMVEDHVTPNAEGNLLTRTLTFTEGNPDGKTYLKLAQGDHIETMPDGSYVVDQQYYIRVPADEQVTVRTVDQQQELVTPLQSSSFEYSIIW
ncbi:MAG: DUF1080 domain-containing protein [Cyclobacteriaceae bacterium]